MKKFILVLFILGIYNPVFAISLIGSGPNGVGGGDTVSYDSYEVGTNTGSGCDIDVPSNTQDGDMLVVVLNNDDGVAIVATGWTEIQYCNGYASADLAMFYRVASSEPASYDFGSSSQLTGIMMLFTKSGGTWNVVDDSGKDDGGNTTATISNITATAGGVLIFGWGSDDVTTVSNAPDDMVQVAINSPGSSHVGAWYQTGIAAIDYSKTIDLTGGDNGGILAAIGIN